MNAAERRDSFPPDAQSDLRRRFAQLMDHLPAGVVVHGDDGRILLVNHMACALLDRRAVDLIGTDHAGGPWHMLRADGSQLPAEDSPVNVVLRTREKLASQIYGIILPGRETVRWMIANAYPELDPDGGPMRVVVCFTDCTALKYAEQLLQKSEQRLKLILRGSTDAPWDIDLATGEVYYSQRWWEMLGYQPGDIPAGIDTWAELMHPDDRASLHAFMKEMLASTRQSYSFECRLLHRDGRPVHVLARGFVLRDASGRALRLSGTNTDLTERRQAELKIHELAYFDPLTGLPNRRHLLEELDSVLRKGRDLPRLGALMFIDLDNFKLLNDTMGHAVGDQLLRQVSERLRSVLRQGALAARLGGDEFVVVLPDLGNDREQAANAAQAEAQALLLVLCQPFDLGGYTTRSTPSIGIALFDRHTASVEALLMQADLAMYRAKSDGRNTARFYEPGMHAQAERRAALERALRAALEQGQFILHYQPQFDIENRLIGAEALVRWPREDGTMSQPDEFIALAESTGLIVPLGRQVFEQACQTVVRWAAQPHLATLKLAVNVSVQQLRDPQFLDTVRQSLEQSGADPARLQLEITESVFADDLAITGQRMHALRQLGLQFALDDFGTGYSSLAYIRRLPLSTIKIDRAFINDLDHDPQAAAIIEAIVTLAHKLGINVIAEGVETELQLSFLRHCGCAGLQGYLLGRPVALDQFEQRYGALAAPGVSSRPA